MMGLKFALPVFLTLITVAAADEIRVAAAADLNYAFRDIAARLYEKLRDKFVLGENISQAAQFV